MAETFESNLLSQPATTVQEAIDTSRREEEQSEPELAKIVGRSRWEHRDGPFRGFGSPQGKF